MSGERGIDGTKIMKTTPTTIRTTRVARRGNAMILVAGILVLLVITAAAYITGAQGGRVSAVAVQQAATRENNIRVIADTLADEISRALFAEPIDPFQLGGAPLGRTTIADSNWPRRATPPNARRYSVDYQDEITNTTGVLVPDGVPDFPYNFAPYHVVPWTNWPDGTGVGDPPVWPVGRGTGHGSVTGLAEGNPWGNPGFGDTRWLRDTEPVRHSHAGDRQDSFRFWRHLTNISRPNNAWRICRDISDVTNVRGRADMGNGIVFDLSLPVEQWLVSIYPPDVLFDPATGDAVYDGPGGAVNPFYERWQHWFNTPVQGLSTGGWYGTAYQNASPYGIPPNFYNLNNLFNGAGPGIPNEPGETPPDEFVGPGRTDSGGNTWLAGTPRWDVSRILADSDGDGFTDSFWFLAPTPVERGVRQVVAVSIVDNSSMLNANVATNFWPGDPDTRFAKFRATRGETPSDLALAGQQQPWTTFSLSPPANWNVGYFDDYANDERAFAFPAYYAGAYPGYYGHAPFYPLYDNPLTVLGEDSLQVSWSNAGWDDFLRELGVLDNPENDMTAPAGPFPQVQSIGAFTTAIERRRYWQKSGRQPFNPVGGLTPFTMADEIELRMFQGQNYPWIMSRFERAVQPNFNDQSFAILRANNSFQETTPYLDELTNTELLHDNRRHLTMHSGARNDLLPPWLRWNWRDDFGTIVRDDVPQKIRDTLPPLSGAQAQLVLRRFFEQSLYKLDLREPPPDDLGIDLKNDLWARPYLLFEERLPHMLLRALTDESGEIVGTVGTGTRHSYLRPLETAEDWVEMQELVAAFTANILAFRDADDRAELNDIPGTYRTEGAVPLPEWEGLAGTANANGARFLGMEQQPFLLEAFVAHVYKPWEIEAVEGEGDPPDSHWINEQKIIVDEGRGETDESRRTTVVVVQIANPFDRPIVLDDPDPTQPHYEIELFGQLPAISLREVARQLGITELAPSREDHPSTMTLYSIANNALGEPAFKIQWADFLDLEGTDHPGQWQNPADITAPPEGGTILADLTAMQAAGAPIQAWSNDRDDYDRSENQDVLLVRVYPGEPSGGDERVVVDRFTDEHDDSEDGNSARPDGFFTGNNERITFGREVAAMGLPPNRPPRYRDLEPIPAPTQTRPHPRHPVEVPFSSTEPSIPWVPYAQALTHWTQFVRVTRAWGGTMHRNPRYVFATHAITTSRSPSDDPRADYPLRRQVGDPGGGGGGPFHMGVSFSLGLAPDDGEPNPADPGGPGLPWITLRYDNGNRKPTFFSTNPDKGYYFEYDFAMQMLQKDDDFQQVGELLNVWLYGHRLEGTIEPPVPPYFYPTFNYAETRQTFSEYMSEAMRDGLNTDPLLGSRDPPDEGEGLEDAPSWMLRVNRLKLGELIGNGDLSGTVFDRLDPDQATPVLPAGARLLEGFVCDDRGQLRVWRGPAIGFETRDLNGDGVGNSSDVDFWNEEAWFGNANRFSGRISPGLVNVNTATEEVLRALPHWAKLVHSDPVTIPESPRMGVSRGVISYRDRLENFDVAGPFRRGYPNGPDYSARELIANRGTVPGTGDTRGVEERINRTERGIASIGELRLVTKPALALVTGVGTTDPIGPATWSITSAADGLFSSVGSFVGTDLQGQPIDATGGDLVGADAEEANLLLAGASNMITTRSDVFTVYFRVRNFRQNPDTLVWDATDPRHIIDDTRYVMLVDRSEVNTPRDRPKILYMEKVPN